MMDYSFLEGDSMTLDSEQQRAFLLEMFKQVNFPGQVLELAYQTQQALKNAQVLPDIPKLDPARASD